MNLDQAREWETDGHFHDRDGRAVKAFDDVMLLSDATCVSAGTVSVDRILAGSIGTVIFVTKDEPVWLQLECDVGAGFAFADNYPASQVTLHRTTEEKWPDVPNL